MEFSFSFSVLFPGNGSLVAPQSLADYRYFMLCIERQSSDLIRLCSFNKIYQQLYRQFFFDTTALWVEYRTASNGMPSLKQSHALAHLYTQETAAYTQQVTVWSKHFTL
jgi:hypothetical protein